MIYPVPKPAPKLKSPRRASLPKRRTEERRSGRERDPAYLVKVRGLPCCVGHGCEGRVEADHAGPRPLGRKSHDREAIPLCQKHHWQRTNYVGNFSALSASEMRIWCNCRIAETQARLGYVASSEERP